MKREEVKHMDKFDANWEVEMQAKRAFLAEHGLYREEDEHSSCGVGLVVSIDGEKSRKVVDAGIRALKAVWHRGAVDADGKTGDGAGIHIQIPREFFIDQIRRTGHEAADHHIAVGMAFLPHTNFAAQEACRTIVETEILRMGHKIYGWRQVPVEVGCLGQKANATRPEIEQIMIGDDKDLSEEDFERELFIIRRRIEKAISAAGIQGAYICSLSCRSVIYKGMFLAEDISNFYSDLNDERFISAFAIYHQRYSTNTFPQWWLAQPFRMLAHNGEINTLKGNVNWMKSHEIRMASNSFGDNADDVKPIVQPGSSDSAALDSVFEVMVRAGRIAPMVKTMLVPESWSNDREMPESWKNMYAYANSVMEPWDGPAALAMTDGQWVCAGLDRNGLRPVRYVITKDKLLIAGSEVGMVPVTDENVVEKGALGPGEMIAVNMETKELFHDAEMKDWLASLNPYEQWVGKITELDKIIAVAPNEEGYSGAELRRRQIAAGFTVEEVEMVLQPMADDGKEALASMGDDTPSAVLSGKYRPLHHYFRQNFSQVTNPPIDSLRESRVMSLKTRFGNLKNVLDQSGAQTEILSLDSPVLTNAQFDAMFKYFEDAKEIDCSFEPTDDDDDLRQAIEAIRAEAEVAVRAGAQHIILSDRGQNETRVGLPMILATSAVHTHLVRKGLRTFCSINVRSAECLDPHYFAVLVGAGATTVNPYLAVDTLRMRGEKGLLNNTLAEALANYKEAINQGLLKIMSKMGISVLSSYRGGLNFEAVGLSRALVAEYFPGMQSRISGIGLKGLRQQALEIHQKGWKQDSVLPIGGFYKLRAEGERHAWQAKSMHLLQQACNTGKYQIWKQYSQLMQSQEPIHLRDLLDFKAAGPKVPLEEVESITSIRKRFVTPGMSLGALSPEAHKTLNIAMNRIGAKSDSGEGGEDPAHFHPMPNGDNASAKIKQVASGRFGVTAEYLNHCEELEIKVAQGAKPGEGGQLPGMKVTELIARLRHSTPGVTLISPPPHHDIYSIEDLAQLIYDLKQINPRAKVTVKLVASSGVGTIAAGVAKAKADIILISGHNGGTGASPATSIKFAGLPWEMGLSEAHQVLAINDLRERITLRTDGGLRTGRDVVMAAMLGAEEYGIGTAALIAMGCIMVRQCQSNTCPVGVCVQDERLRAKFTGTADKVVNLITHYAHEIREILSELGVRSLDEIIGRADLLAQVSRGAEHLDDLDLNPLLISVSNEGEIKYDRNKPRNSVPETLDKQIIADADPFFKDGEKIELSYTIENTSRTVGTRVSSHIVSRFGMRNALQEDHLTLRLSGSAGQSLGAFSTRGLKIVVTGDANDYVGKGLSGGMIVVKPGSLLEAQAAKDTIVGNTVLYGATDGLLLVAGRAGQRFAVRNSGAKVVVEGCGANGCEYMTGGVAVILGEIGDNFGAGMTGGMAFIYDPAKTAELRMNRDSIVIQSIETDHWFGSLKSLIEKHVEETNSLRGREILRNWDHAKYDFLQICPKEMVKRLEFPLKATA